MIFIEWTRVRRKRDEMKKCGLERLAARKRDITKILQRSPVSLIQFFQCFPSSPRQTGKDQRNPGVCTSDFTITTQWDRSREEPVVGKLKLRSAESGNVQTVGLFVEDRMNSIKVFIGIKFLLNNSNCFHLCRFTFNANIQLIQMMSSRCRFQAVLP